MATSRFLNLRRSLNFSVKFANQLDVRPSFAHINQNNHFRESGYTTNFTESDIGLLGFNTAGHSQHRRANHVTTVFGRPMSNWGSLRPSVSLVGVSCFQNCSYFSSSSGRDNSSRGPEAPSASGGGDPAMGDSGVGGSDWSDKAKEAWQSVVDAVSFTGEKAKEASNEVTPYVQQVLDAHPYLRDVIVPVGGTLVGTLLVWAVLSRVLKRFHKYSMQGPAAWFSGSAVWGPVSYEQSVWGALEDPIRYLITFMAFSQIALMVAPATFASQYLTQTWRGALTLSFVWFLHRWKTNVISRALTVKSIEAAERNKLLSLDKVSSVGMLVIGVLSLAEVCGVPVQSLLTVGGIGGVATAFAARDIIGNVFSGLSVQISQPFSIGDTIKAGSVEGQVVEMGLTTTSLLTAEKFPVIVPNSLFSSQVIVNKSRAQFRATVSRIPVQIHDIDKIPEISENIKTMLRSNSNVFLEREQPYCFLSRIERSFAELTLGCNLKHMSKEQLFSTEQDILLQSVKIIKQHGADLANTTGE